MKVTLVGKQHLDFDSDDGKKIVGTKLHVVSLFDENEEDMEGCRVAAIFTRLPCDSLVIGGPIELTYENTLGSNKSRLVSVVNCGASVGAEAKATVKS